jgi:hypothetical protein
MRFSLRTLLIVMLLAGPVSALAYRARTDYRKRLEIDATHAAATIEFHSLNTSGLPARSLTTP